MFNNEENDSARQMIFDAIGAPRFEEKTYMSAKRNAQMNLDGRSHYVDDQTLKFFHAKIVSSRHEDSGLLFSIVESVAKDHENKSRGFRFVVFDLFGTVIERNNTRDVFYSTSEKARAARNVWLDNFDTLAYYGRAMAEKAETLARHAERLETASKRL